MKNPIRAIRKNGRFNLFFVEMIIVLLFFSIAAGIILRSFAASDKLARDSRRMESMAFCAQSAAEIYSRTASVSETAAVLFGKDTSIFSGNEGISSIRVPVSADGSYSPSSPDFYMTMSETKEDHGRGQISILNISFSDDSSGEILYEVRSGAYSSERAVSGIE